MLQKKKLSTSTTRFATIMRLIDFKRYNQVIKLKHKTLFKKNKKKFYNFNKPTVTFNNFTNLSGVVCQGFYNKKPYQSFFSIKSIYNNWLIVPGVEFILPGFKFLNFTKNITFNKLFFLGSQIFLEDLPYGLSASYLSNNLNTKWTYARCSGTFVTKLKAKKSVKLIYVELPSLITYLFFKKTKCFIGKNDNFLNNKFYEGKWGFSIHRFKSISVRGVAMNPVDHPNGGRTKSKQPEKSPWGWIAKHNK